jgi:hypothetical protein
MRYAPCAMRSGCRLFFFPLAKRSSNLPRGMNSQSMFHGAKCSSSAALLQPRSVSSLLLALRYALCAMRSALCAMRYAPCALRHAPCALRSARLSLLDLHLSGIDRSFSAVDTDPCPGFQRDLVDCATALFLHADEVKSTHHTGLPKPVGYDSRVRG